jgi:hypothetical protein
MEDHDGEIQEAADILDGEEDDAPAPPTGLGALGQLAVAVLVVGLLIAGFIGGSAVLHRIFG